jgi:hypothetical protein
MFRLPFLVLALAGFLAAGGMTPPRPVDNQRIYVAVADQKGKPVTGLTAADFTVKLDQATQEVLKVEPATEPASIVILTDRLGLNGMFTAFDVGEALKDFAKAVRKSSSESVFALTTFDGAVVQVTKFTSAYGETERALGRLMTQPNPTALFDGLMSACQTLRSAPTERKIIFTLIASYRGDSSVTHADIVGENVRLSGASLWAVEARQAEGGNITNSAREQVLDAGSALSGGFHDVVSTRNGLSLATRRAAELIGSQYAVTFGPGGGTNRTSLTVQVKRPGVRVLAPGWTTK